MAVPLRLFSPFLRSIIALVCSVEMTAENANGAGSLEGRTQLIGQELLRRAGRQSRHIHTMDLWESRLLELFMADEDVRTRLLRFVEVYPALRGADRVAEHLAQYLPPGLHDLPLAVKLGEILSQGGFAARALTARAISVSMKRMSRHFVCGETADQAIAAIRRLDRQGMVFTVDILGEEVLSDLEAAEHAESYLSMLGQLSRALGNGHQVNLSLKLSALYPHFDPAAPKNVARHVMPRLLKIAEAARQAGAFLNIDMEQYERRDLTLSLFTQLVRHPDFNDYPHLGIVLQAYQIDTREALRFLLETAECTAPFTVRLVKGAYWDYEVAHARQLNYPVPVFAEKWQTDAAFELLTEELLQAAPRIRTAVASHNVRSLARAIAVARQLDVPRESFEVQMLYGMGDPIKHALVEMSVPVRVYLPYGPMVPGMGYLVRRLLENTANNGFLRMDFFEHAAEEQLLRDPAEAALPVRPRNSSPRPGFANHPPLDFSLRGEREAFHQVLLELPACFGKLIPAVIDGKEYLPQELPRCAPESWIASSCPSHPDVVVGWSARAGIRLAEEALRSAFEAFHSWSITPVEQRATVLEKTADYIANHRYDFAAWAVHEAGKPWREADGDVCEAIDFLRYYAGQMRELAAPRALQPLPGERNEYAYFPLGMGVVIAPWNFPLAIITGMVAAAVVAGNTVVMKPAEQTPVCAYRIFQAFQHGGGIPPGVINFLPGFGEEIGDCLVTHPATAFVAFTGSEAVGVHINELAARPRERQRGVARVIAEMGGKNAIIVDASADIDAAVAGTIRSAFFYAGQKCSAASRVIVLDEIYDEFVPRLCGATKSLIVGPSEDPATQVGPLIDMDAVKRVRKHGARSTGSLRSQLVPPVVIEVSNDRGALAQEEIFGPVLAVLRAHDFDEAITIANNTRFALTAGLYSRTPLHIEKARLQVAAGNLYVNRPITGAIVGRQPFGGFRMSGIGSKAGGPDYLKQFLVPRVFSENTMRHGFAPLAPDDI